MLSYTADSQTSLYLEPSIYCYLQRYRCILGMACTPACTFLLIILSSWLDGQFHPSDYEDILGSMHTCGYLSRLSQVKVKPTLSQLC